MRALNIIFFLIAFNGVFAQKPTITYYEDKGAFPGEKIIELNHMNANVSFNPEEYQVFGDVVFDYVVLRDADEVKFYTPDFEFQAIEIDGHECEYEITGNYVIVRPDKAFVKKSNGSIRFEYIATPHSGVIYFVGFDEGSTRRKQIWAHRPHGWLPYMDARLTVDMHITYDNDMKVFSNGERISVDDNGDGTSTWHYRMDHNHPYFSTALAIGNYDYKESVTEGGVPLELWYYPEYEDRFDITYMYSAEMMDYFEEELGFDYPWPLYRQAPVADYMYGAMETTTSTIFGDYMQIDTAAWWQRNYVNVNAHELAHQWFGNYISHLAARDIWLTEGFGTYYAKMFELHQFGYDYYQDNRLGEIEIVMEKESKDDYPLGSSFAGSERWYQKGSLVLDMLRYVLGDEDFRAAVTYYLEQNQYTTARIIDFYDAVYETSGRDISWFIDKWINRGGVPEYEIGWQQYSIEGKEFTEINVQQIHERNDLVGLFRMPVGIKVVYNDFSSDSVNVWIEEETTRVKVENSSAKEIAYILFDPGSRILKKVKFDKPYEMLALQAVNAVDILDRYDAVRAMETYPVDRKIHVFEKVWAGEVFHTVKSEIIRQIADNNSLRALELLKKAINDKDGHVRLAVVENVTKVDKSLQAEYEALLDDIAYNVQELALENLFYSFPGKRLDYLRKMQDRKGWRGDNIKLKWLELAIVNNMTEYTAELEGYTSPDNDFEARINAYNVCTDVGFFNYNVCRNMVEGAFHWNFKISRAARAALKHFYQEISGQQIIEQYINTLEEDKKLKIKKILTYYN